MHELNGDWLRVPPFVLRWVHRGVVGNSRFACCLHSAIQAATKVPKREPVLIWAQLDMETDNIAALIHFG